MRRLLPKRCRTVALTIILVTVSSLVLERLSYVSTLRLSDLDRVLRLNKEKEALARREERFYRYQLAEANRTGPGEGGNALKLTKEESALIKSQMKREGFSKYINSLVSLDRSLRDYRNEVCKEHQYPEDLPVASVIIIFRNELQRVVLRTVHSVINRTPPQYLKEVILVDDASDREELLQPLDEHIKEHWPEGHVKVIRLPTRSGLIRTRLAGVAAARGDVVIIMDGHMEATKGWIEPLLARIKENNKILVAPLIDSIRPNDMQYSTSILFYQTFTWNMEYYWQTLPGAATHNHLEPYPTFALVGCIMAMHRSTFIEMGAFDVGMDVWGGENVELPIRIWMCGGRVEIIPCSRVAHTYRAGWGRPWNSSNTGYFSTNIQRIAEVWLDEYKDEFYALHLSLKKRAPEIRANITDRLALRKRLRCKSFKWLLDNVVRPPMFMYTRNVTNWGQLKQHTTGLCLDTYNVNTYADGPVGVYQCHTQNGNQIFALTLSNHLRRQTHCLCYRQRVPGKKVYLAQVCEDKTTQKWLYNTETSQIIHENTKLCLENPNRAAAPNVILSLCTRSPSQIWIWEH